MDKNSCDTLYHNTQAKLVSEVMKRTKQEISKNNLPYFTDKFQCLNCSFGWFLLREYLFGRPKSPEIFELIPMKTRDFFGKTSLQAFVAGRLMNSGGEKRSFSL